MRVWKKILYTQESNQLNSSYGKVPASTPQSHSAMIFYSYIRLNKIFFVVIEVLKSSSELDDYSDVFDIQQVGTNWSAMIKKYEKLVKI